MPGKFEAHIALDKEHGPRLKAGLLGWQYSALDDDPSCSGPLEQAGQPYCYLTAYEPDAQRLKERMDLVADIIETEMKIPVLRTKIERIIYDSKTGVNEL